MIENNIDDRDMQCAKDNRELSFRNLDACRQRSGDLADEFTRLEVQMAVLLLPFSGLFLSSLSDKTTNFLYPSLLKFSFAISVLFLTMSLVMGLLHIKRKEMWWKEQLDENGARFGIWSDVVHRKGISFKDAQAFHSGTNLGKNGLVSTPKWTWILQTIFLAVAIVLLFILFYF